ncbi:MAG: N-formylglutamate deformylase [Comamonas sp.]
MSDATFHFERGTAPLLISIPHLGTEIPPAIAGRLTPEALTLADTDWHLDRLYAFARRLGASVISARYSRYVVDLNRPRSGESLYPGQTTTGLFPLETFRGELVYRAGEAPQAEEQALRAERYWQPYHAQLEAELHRLREDHGQALLWDGHSIASVLPRLFEQQLPDLNLGTNSGASCGADVFQGVLDVVQVQQRYSWVSNGRFKGGYITRHYGQPQQGIHAIQLEMSQCVYMDETAPFAYREGLAGQVQPLVERMVEAALARVRS